MNKHLEAVLAEIKKRAALYCKDNPRTCQGREHEIETMMLIGASIVFETDDIFEEETVSEADKVLTEVFRCPCGEHH